MDPRDGQSLVLRSVYGLLRVDGQVRWVKVRSAEVGPMVELLHRSRIRRHVPPSARIGEKGKNDMCIAWSWESTLVDGCMDLFGFIYIYLLNQQPAKSKDVG